MSRKLGGWALACLVAVGCGQAPNPNDEIKGELQSGNTGSTGAMPEGGATAMYRGDYPGMAKSAEPAAAPAAVDLQTISLSDDEIAEIKKLPEAEQTAALDQKICPVGEDAEGKPNHLGSMGAPIKVDIKGRAVYVCCKGCVAELEAEPDKFLAKLAAAPAAAAPAEATPAPAEAAPAPARAPDAPKEEPAPPAEAPAEPKAP
jgi:hypothetical protein